MSYLFLVNIGPVQDFIASARRTRDLHFGSWFLSELARAAAHEIVVHNGLDSLIFPAPTSVDWLKPYNKTFIVANKIIARVQQSPQTLGKLVRHAVFTQLHDIRDKSYKDISFQKGMRSIAEAQVEDLVEYFWVALPFDRQSYQITRKQLEALMAARKNTRDFAQTTLWQAPVPKSSLDGKLESVILEQAYPSPGASEEERREKIRWLYDNYRAGPAERLSGVDLLKRRGATAFDVSFPSTSHMATLPFLERLKVLKNRHLEQAREAWNAYIEKMQELVPRSQLELERIPNTHTYSPHPILNSYEGSMLFEERLVDVLYEPGVEMSRNTDLQEAKKALDTFYQVIDQRFSSLGFGKTRPSSYYALLQADGDRMGGIINAQTEPGQHQKLSQRLSSFTGRAREIVQRHRGALVYAGGDDVMAFLPLDTVLECARELAREFRKALQVFPDQQGLTPSLSVGIAIAHHLDSLMKVRRLAKEAENYAKKVPNKNALAITVSKRSGEDYSIAGHWGDLDINLQQYIDFCLRGAIPVGTAYELRDLVQRLGIPMHDKQISTQREQSVESLIHVIQWDALRILQRKLYVPQGKLPKEQAGQVEQVFKAHLSIEQELLSVGDGKPVSLYVKKLDRLINGLIIAQVLADAIKLAQPVRKGNQL